MIYKHNILVVGAALVALSTKLGDKEAGKTENGFAFNLLIVSKYRISFVKMGSLPDSILFRIMRNYRQKAPTG